MRFSQFPVFPPEAELDAYLNLHLNLQDDPALYTMKQQLYFSWQ